MGEQPEGVGVAFEVRDVIPERLADMLAETEPHVFGEERLNGLLAGVAEWRVAHVVSQPRALHDGANLLKQGAAQLRMDVDEPARHIVAETLAERRYLERVRQAVMNEDAARQGEHLRLVLQTAERRRVDEAVAVTFEFRSVVVAQRVAQLLSEAFVGDKL